VDLRDQIAALAPWHFDIEINGVRTGAFANGMNVLTPAAGESMRARLLRLYPDGLQGRSVLDCGCNCGAYLFAAKDVGAGHCLGFDVREHWIRQARFLADQKGYRDVEFRVIGLGDEPLPQFDVVLFLGILYHLPDPLRGLKLVADATREVLIVNTATRPDYPDGGWVASFEDPEHPLSGVDGTNWYPAGPGSLAPYLAVLGLPYVEVESHREDVYPNDKRARLSLLASRSRLSPSFQRAERWVPTHT
jgi:SAM-dependent methyltransferase